MLAFFRAPVLAVVGVFMVSVGSGVEDGDGRRGKVYSMNDPGNADPLVFESIADVRNRLMGIYKEGGLEEVKKYVTSEFVSERPIQLGEQTFRIFDVQLRSLEDGEAGDVVIDYKHEPTSENSRLLLTANLVDIGPTLQLIVRRQP